MMAFEPVPAKDVLLQQPPFVFIDRIVHYDDSVTGIQYRVPETGLLVEDGSLCASGMMEHMAQSMAAREGYVSRYILHIPIRLGMLGQIKNFSLYRHARSGELLETTVRLTHEMMGISLAEITVCCQGETVAEAIIKTVITNEE